MQVCRNGWTRALGVSNDRVARAQKAVLAGVTRVVHGGTGNGKL